MLFSKKLKIEHFSLLFVPETLVYKLTILEIFPTIFCNFFFIEIFAKYSQVCSLPLDQTLALLQDIQNLRKGL